MKKILLTFSLLAFVFIANAQFTTQQFSFCGPYKLCWQGSIFYGSRDQIAQLAWLPLVQPSDPRIFLSEDPVTKKIGIMARSPINGDWGLVRQVSPGTRVEFYLHPTRDGERIYINGNYVETVFFTN